MLIFKKEKAVIELARDHVDCMISCVQGAATTFQAYLANEAATVAEASEDVDRHETLADSKRREIGDLLYAGAYLPAIREDIYTVVDAVDVVAGSAESLCDFLNDQQPEIPAMLHEDFSIMVDLTVDIAMALRMTLRAFYKKKGKRETVRMRAAEVGKLESQIDAIETALTRKIFGSALDIGHKVHLRNAVAHIVRISDSAEDAADRIELVSLKALV